MDSHDTTPTDPEDEDFDDPTRALYNARSHLDDEEPPLGFATQTSFDNYFVQSSKPSRTSANVFSHIVPPLAPDAYAAILARLPRTQVLWTDAGARAALFARWRTELREGFNLLFYGYGSKRDVLNAFARALARSAHVVVANAYAPAFALKDLFAALEPVAAGGGSAEAQAQRVHAAFAGARGAHLYVVLHNIDAPALRGARARACLALLARAPRIHLVASVDHVAAGQRWTLGELFARAGAGTAGRGFAWLWHDLTTLAPYDVELAAADPSSFAGAAGVRGGRAGRDAAVAGASAGAAGVVSESAARHVLAAVTQKARRLFVLLGAKQLALMESDGAAGAGAAFDYAQLFGAARDEFIATNDTALRALLGEFRDHGLVMSAASGGAAEALWIPMRRDALSKILGELQAEQA